jgi:hypothetical protein
MPGERSTTLYAAFCPPFERLPRVEVELVEESVLHNGIQLEIRLAKPAHGQGGLAVEFFAAEPGERESS